MTWLASLICGISFFSGASFCEKPNLAAAPFVFTVGQGGTATSVSPIAGDLLMSWKAGSYGPTSLIAGSNITISTSTYRQITISSTASSGSSDWQFSGATAITPTTTVGILVNASSTIGAGGQTTGLTVSGGSTTTLNALFQGDVE